MRIDRLTKVDPDDVVSLDVLTLAPEIERGLATEARDWNGLRLVTVRRESLIFLKRLRSSAQDVADIEKLMNLPHHLHHQPTMWIEISVPYRNCEKLCLSLSRSAPIERDGVPERSTLLPVDFLLQHRRSG